jgi:beta-phosphoglucomutase-like phosphatase (HAD superfamily)
MIFFDIDGTLIDHASASAQASLIFFDQFPGAIPFARSEYPAAWSISSTNTLSVGAAAKFRFGSSGGRA